MFTNLVVVPTYTVFLLSLSEGAEFSNGTDDEFLVELCGVQKLQ